MNSDGWSAVDGRRSSDELLDRESLKRMSVDKVVVNRAIPDKRLLAQKIWT